MHSPEPTSENWGGLAKLVQTSNERLLSIRRTELIYMISP